MVRQAMIAKLRNAFAYRRKSAPVRPLSRGEEFVFVAPQCPKDKSWIVSPWSAMEHRMAEQPTPWLAHALEIIEDAVKRYPVDPDRVYIMGISAGGYATWELLQRRPKLFAAALPCCGGGDTTLASNLTDVAIWVFHGGEDKVVPVYRSQSMVAAIRAAGGRKIRYREYPGVRHDAWTPTFTNPKVFEWLFAQRRGKPDPTDEEPQPQTNGQSHP